MSGEKKKSVYNAEYQRKYLQAHPGLQVAKNYKSMKKKLAAEYGMTPEEMEALLTAAQKRKERKAAKQAD